jgi:hypothetical protein
MICVYCNQESDESTEEHVVPKAIGGNIEPTNPFKLKDVCPRCNRLRGLFVDGPFIRSGLTQQGRASSAVKAFKPGVTDFLPLNYMGYLEELHVGTRVCEFWLGPTGDRIYHFHEPYPDEPGSLTAVGPPLHIPRELVDPGFVFLFIRSNNRVWWPVIFSSVVRHFSGSQFYLGNGPVPRGGAFSEIAGEMVDVHERLKTLDGVEHRATGRLARDYGSRFLAKLALGLGGLFLSSSFRTSASAELLRKFLWTKSLEERQQIPLRGRNFIAPSDPNFANLAAFLRWPGGHVLVMLPWAVLTLYVAFFEGQSATVAITNEPEHWKDINGQGAMYIISPGLRKCVGPLTLTAFIAHKMGILRDGSLAQLEEEERVSPLPPFDLPTQAE